MGNTNIGLTQAGTSGDNKLYTKIDGVTTEFDASQVRDGLSGGGGGGVIPTSGSVYVSSDGSPSGDGSFENPFNTLEAAVAAVPLFGSVECIDSSVLVVSSTINIAPGVTKINCPSAVIQGPGDQPTFVCADGSSLIIRAKVIIDGDIFNPPSQPTTSPIFVLGGVTFDMQCTGIISYSDAFPIIVSTSTELTASVVCQTINGRYFFFQPVQSEIRQLYLRVYEKYRGDIIDSRVFSSSTVQAMNGNSIYNSLLFDSGAEFDDIPIPSGNSGGSIFMSLEGIPFVKLVSGSVVPLSGPIIGMNHTILETDFITTNNVLTYTGLSVVYTPKSIYSKLRITVSGFFQVSNISGLVSSGERLMSVAIKRATGIPDNVMTGEIGRLMSSPTTSADRSSDLTSFCCYDDLNGDISAQRYELHIASVATSMSAAVLGSLGIQASITVEEIIDDVLPPV